MLQAKDRYYSPDMPVAEAMAMHPRVAEVFAAFHLGGCSHCGISHYETIEQVCMAYGVDVEVLLEVLEGLMEQPATAGAENPEQSDSNAPSGISGGNADVEAAEEDTGSKGAV